jgi:hypothetical protein
MQGSPHSEIPYTHCPVWLQVMIAMAPSCPEPLLAPGVQGSPQASPSHGSPGHRGMLVTHFPIWQLASGQALVPSGHVPHGNSGTPQSASLWHAGGHSGTSTSHTPPTQRAVAQRLLPSSQIAHTSGTPQSPSVLHSGSEQLLGMELHVPSGEQYPTGGSAASESRALPAGVHRALQGFPAHSSTLPPDPALTLPPDPADEPLPPDALEPPLPPEDCSPAWPASPASPSPSLNDSPPQAATSAAQPKNRSQFEVCIQDAPASHLVWHEPGHLAAPRF